MEYVTENGKQMTDNEIALVTNGLSVRTNATLRDDDWKRFDAELLEISRQRLTLVNDLRSAGLTMDLGGLGTTLSVIELSTDQIEANVSMDGATKGNKDIHEFEQIAFPVPIFHREFTIGFRQLLASRSGLGPALDTSNISMATRRVTDRIEDMIVNGVPEIKVGGSEIFGYATHPTVVSNAVTITDWATIGGAAIIAEVLQLLQAQYDQNRFGPFTLYVPKNFWAAIQDDFSTEKGDNTIMERILAFSDINAVRPADSLADSKVVLVQMTRDTVDLGVAQDIVNVEMNTPRATENSMFKVFGSMVIRVKEDADNTVGIILGQL